MSTETIQSAMRQHSQNCRHGGPDISNKNIINTMHQLEALAALIRDDIGQEQPDPTKVFEITGKFTTPHTIDLHRKKVVLSFGNFWILRSALNWL